MQQELRRIQDEGNQASHAVEDVQARLGRQCQPSQGAPLSGPCPVVCSSNKPH